MKTSFLIILFFINQAPISAHSGGTDRAGGHHDHYHGGYHFHHGYGPHQHPYGICELKSIELKPYAQKYPDSIQPPYNFFQRMSWKDYLLMLLFGFGITRFYQLVNKVE